MKTKSIKQTETSRQISIEHYCTSLVYDFCGFLVFIVSDSFFYYFNGFAHLRVCFSCALTVSCVSPLFYCPVSADDALVLISIFLPLLHQPFFLLFLSAVSWWLSLFRVALSSAQVVSRHVRLLLFFCIC